MNSHETARAPGSVRQSLNQRDRGLSELDTVDLAVELTRRMMAGESVDETFRKANMLSLLGGVLDLRLDRFENRFSYAKSSVLLHQLRRHPDFAPALLRGAQVVELGCGAANPLSALMILAAAGASHCVGVDLDSPSNEAVTARAMYRIAVEMLARPDDLLPGLGLDNSDVARHLAGIDLGRLSKGDPSAVDPALLELRQCSASETGCVDGSVDVVLSSSFLEHIPGLDEVLVEMARILRPGGICVHRIDGVDHQKYIEPSHHALGFLSEPVDEALVHGCNRVRPLEYAALFERHGFEVLHVDPFERIDVDDALRSSFVEPFRSKDQDVLEVVGAELHLRRR